jgi:transposase
LLCDVSAVAEERSAVGDVVSWQARAEWYEARLGEVVAANAGLSEALEKAVAENRELRVSLEQVTGELATLKRMVFGDSSEKGPRGGAPDTGPDVGVGVGGGEKQRGQRAGAPGPRRRDFSPLPTVDIIYDLGAGERCCAGCGSGFAPFGEQVFEQVDWQVVLVRLLHRRRRYTRTCRCAGPRVITAPGPAKAIGKGRFTHGFLARLLVGKFVAGQPLHKITAGLARDGLDVPDSTLIGALQQVGKLLVPLQAAIAARNRAAAHVHVDETTWKVFEPVEGKDSARWWLWVFCATDTICFQMDPTRSTSVATEHLGIDVDAGELISGDRLVISSDFYVAYQSIAANIDAVTPLWCWAHMRRYFVRAGDADPHQLGRWSRLWVQRIRDLYVAHHALARALAIGDGDGDGGEVLAAQQDFDTALGVIDTVRREQMSRPGLQPRAAKVLATLDREWDGLAAHRDFPLLPLDNNTAERALRTPVVGRKNFGGSGTRWAAELAARVWTITATTDLAGLNPITYLTAYLDACGAAGGTPLTPTDLQRFLPWTASTADLAIWAAPPRHDHTPDP